MNFSVEQMVTVTVEMKKSLTLLLIVGTMVEEYLGISLSLSSSDKTSLGVY
jgi:hypothetical protein